MKTFFLIAGEASGDYYGAFLIRELRKRSAINAMGIGGIQMAEAGQDQLFGLESLSVMGLFEGLSELKKIKLIFDQTVTFLERVKVDALILIDFPGFNLKLAKTVCHLGFKIIYYVSPKVWAWNERRVHTIKRSVDMVMSIFPFEIEYFKKWDIPCIYTGNPLAQALDHLQPAPREPGIRIVLMPGSRRSEIKYLLPIFVEAAKRIKDTIAQVTFVIPVADTIDIQNFDRQLKKCCAAVAMPTASISLVKKNRYEIMKSVDFGIIASGTATLEAGILELPMVVVYKVSFVTYQIAKRLVKLSYVGLVNIIAGEEVVPEFIQHKATSQGIAAFVIQVLGSPSAIQEIKFKLRRMKQSLIGKDVKNPADVVLSMVP